MGFLVFPYGFLQINLYTTTGGSTTPCYTRNHETTGPLCRVRNNGVQYGSMSHNGWFQDKGQAGQYFSICEAKGLRPWTCLEHFWMGNWDLRNMSFASGNGKPTLPTWTVKGTTTFLLVSKRYQKGDTMTQNTVWRLLFHTVWCGTTLWHIKEILSPLSANARYVVKYDDEAIWLVKQKGVDSCRRHYVVLLILW